MKTQLSQKRKGEAMAVQTGRNSVFFTISSISILFKFSLILCIIQSYVIERVA